MQNLLGVRLNIYLIKDEVVLDDINLTSLILYLTHLGDQLLLDSIHDLLVGEAV